MGPRLWPTVSFWPTGMLCASFAALKPRVTAAVLRSRGFSVPPLGLRRFVARCNHHAQAQRWWAAVAVRRATILVQFSGTLHNYSVECTVQSIRIRVHCLSVRYDLTNVLRPIQDHHVECAGLRSRGKRWLIGAWELPALTRTFAVLQRQCAPVDLCKSCIDC
jgi:hypothetical protein